MKSLHFQKTNIQFIFSVLTLLESRELQLNSINVFKLAQIFQKQNGGERERET